ncbi:MAG TPA: dihydrodipicolinate reductase [Verrucomicrobiae bacterium]|nr:dihydrodipicolinate reductase [Verrucomicrobiae bacterium]
MSKPIRVIQYGLGAIGRFTAGLMLQRPGLELVGAIDRDPKVAGKDLGAVLGLKRKLGIAVSDKPVVLFAQTQADAVVHCTTSSFVDAYEQITEIVRAGLHCVTSCEEALFPYYRHKLLADKLDDLCVQRSVAVVGTGVNPGLVMDTLALTLTLASQRVDAVRVLRVVDAGTRREALQRKVGATMTKAQFDDLNRQHKIGHVGLAESLLFVADGLGWPLDEVKDTVAPMISKKTIKTKFLTVKKGAVAGVHQFARGIRGGKEVLTLELQMYVGAPKPRDVIEIDGEPPLRLVLEGGVPGDLATPAILANTLPRLVECPPGLHTMRTLGLPRMSL